MRTSIVVWSMVSGAVLGVFVDTVLIGLSVLLAAFMPALSERFAQRWIALVSAVVLALIPAALAFLGFVEGRLKAT